MHFFDEITVGVFFYHYSSFELCSQINLVNALHKISKHTFYHEYSQISRFFTVNELQDTMQSSTDFTEVILQ